MTNKIQQLKALDQQQLLIGVFSLIILSCLFASVILEEFLIALLPFALLFAYVLVVDLQKVYLLFLFILPFSIEIEIPGGLAIDLPAEPILIGFTLISMMLLINFVSRIHKSFFLHPISLLMYLHVAWILLTGLFAEDTVVSVKYLLAKLWFIIPFYIMPIFLIKKFKDMTDMLKALLIAMGIGIALVLLKHASLGFTFAEVNQSVKPFFRNHVNYASIIVILLPFLWAGIAWAKKASVKKYLATAGVVVFIIAIYLTYTRAAMISVIIAALSYFIIKYKLVKTALVTSGIAAMVLIVFLLGGNRFMDFAPEYDRTITHKKFDNLIEATVKLEDISTMERVYRWIAGVNMAKEKPLLGFGPGNFSHSYKSYTLNRFRTYVSNNPDNSGIHNYYLMVLVEQGILGILIFVGLCVQILLTGERLYHRLTDDNYKRLIMACCISIIVIMAILLINDMMEALKVGGLFFLITSFLNIVDCSTDESGKTSIQLIE